MMDLLVTGDWLAAQQGAADLRILDATAFLPGTPRDPTAEYRAAHIPSALFLDLPTLNYADDPRPAMAPSNAQFAARMATLGVGKDADIAVWDQDPYTVAASELKSLRCRLTLLAGEIVFDARHGTGGQ